MYLPLKTKNSLRSGLGLWKNTQSKQKKRWQPIQNSKKRRSLYLLPRPNLTLTLAAAEKGGSRHKFLPVAILLWIGDYRYVCAPDLIPAAPHTAVLPAKANFAVNIVEACDANDDDTSSYAIYTALDTTFTVASRAPRPSESLPSEPACIRVAVGPTCPHSRDRFAPSHPSQLQPIRVNFTSESTSPQTRFDPNRSRPHHVPYY